MDGSTQYVEAARLGVWLDLSLDCERASERKNDSQGQTVVRLLLLLSRLLLQVATSKY